MTHRDRSRQQVYMAEESCLADSGLVRRPGQAVLTAALDALFATRWWTGAVGRTPTVTFADNQGSGFYRHAESRIHLGRTARWLVAAHELAHMARCHAPPHDPGSRAHDEHFCGWEVVVFAAVFGPVAADLLAASFRSMGLPVMLPALDAELPDPPVWRHYIESVERCGWRPPLAGTVTTRAAPAGPIVLGDVQSQP